MLCCKSKDGKSFGMCCTVTHTHTLGGVRNFVLVSYVGQVGALCSHASATLLALLTSLIHLLFCLFNRHVNIGKQKWRINLIVVVYIKHVLIGTVFSETWRCQHKNLTKTDSMFLSQRWTVRGIWLQYWRRYISKTYVTFTSLSPVSTTRVDGPSWRVTGFHYPSTRPVNSASGNARLSTRPVLTGNGNRSPVNSGRQLG